MTVVLLSLQKPGTRNHEHWQVLTYLVNSSRQTTLSSSRLLPISQHSLMYARALCSGVRSLPCPAWQQPLLLAH